MQVINFLSMSYSIGVLHTCQSLKPETDSKGSYQNLMIRGRNHLKLPDYPCKNHMSLKSYCIFYITSSTPVLHVTSILYDIRAMPWTPFLYYMKKIEQIYQEEGTSQSPNITKPGLRWHSSRIGPSLMWIFLWPLGWGT